MFVLWIERAFLNILTDKEREEPIVEFFFFFPGVCAC